MVANPKNDENLTRLNLETILNEILCTDKVENKAYLELNTVLNDYFLILNNYSKIKSGKLTLIIQVI
jgi:hypothetical protein